jgi:hypothetical protein
VSVPQASAFEAPPPNAPPPAAGGAGRKASRLAPRPSAAASAPRLEAPVLDEHHPALAARRPPADAVAPAPEDRTLERQTRKTMWLAVAVLVAIAALVAYLTLGGGSPDGG